MFKIHFVQNFPELNRVVIAGFVALAKFIGKSALGVPGQQTRVIVGNFLA